MSWVRVPAGSYQSKIGNNASSPAWHAGVGVGILCSKHTESVAEFTPSKSLRSRCALEQYANILAHVLNRRVVYLERRVESLAVCMPHMDNKCANFYAKDLTLNAERQRLLCAWALTVMPDCLKGRIVI